MAGSAKIDREAAFIYNRSNGCIMAAEEDTNASKRDPGEALRLCEERFTNLLELSAEWYWEQDENYRFTLITRSGFAAAEDDPLHLIGTARWDHDAVPVGDDGSWDKHKAVLEARQPFADFAFRCVDAQGEMRYISTSGQPVFDERRFTGYRGISKDITASQRAEQLLRLEHMVARCIAGADNASVALKAVIRSLCETQGWECGRYLRVDEPAGVLRFSECWHIPGDAIEQFVASKREDVFGPGVGLAGRAWQSGQPAWIADIKNDARSLKAAMTLETGMNCAFHFPVISEGKTVGVLAFNSRKAREPDERLLQAVRVIGSQVGQYLQRKQAEEDLRRFRVAMDVTADLIFLIDRATMRFVDVNETACKLLGYSREELLGMGPQDLLPIERAKLEKTYDEFIADASSVSGIRSSYRCKDGSTIPFESTPRVQRVGDTYVIAAISRDIREHLAAEEAQRQQIALISQSAEKDRLLRLFYDLPFVGLAVTSPSSMRWLQVNDYMCEMLGYPREELIGLAWTEITHPDDLAANLVLFQRLAAGEFDAFQFDKRFLRKDGGIVDTTMECKCVRRADGSVETVVIMVQNITERKRAERELQHKTQLAQLLEHLARAANEAVSPEAAMQTCLARICEEGKWALGRVATFGTAEPQTKAKHSQWFCTEPARFDAFMRYSDGYEFVGGPSVFINLVLRDQCPVWLPDVKALDRTKFSRMKMADEAGLGSAFAFPVIVMGKVIAILEFFATETRQPDALLIEGTAGLASQFARLVERHRFEESRARLAAIVEYSNDAIIGRALDGAITSWNAAAERIFGYTAAEVIGRNLVEFFPPEARQQFAEIRNLVRTGQPVPSYEAVRIAKDGRRIDVTVSLSSIRDNSGSIVGTAAIVRDISERKRAQEAQARLAAIVENSNDPIIGRTTDGTITSWNTAAERLFGYSATEAVGQSASLIIPPDLQAQAEQRRAQLESGHVLPSFETERIAKDGRRIPVSLSRSAIRDEHGVIIGVSVIFRDITERKRAEEQLSALNAELELKVASRTKELANALVAALAADRIKVDFMANITHELRTPLNSVIGFAELLKDEVPGPLNAKQAVFAADILASGQHLLALVEGILEMSRFDMAEAAIEREPVVIGAAVEARVAAHRKAAEERKVHIALEAAADTGHAELDPSALRRMLDALLANAIKFNREGGTVAVSARRVGGGIEIAVADTGIGIAREDLAKLFKPLVQLDAGLARAHGGVGLGLALASRLAKLHGGSIEVESEPGKGSTFKLCLPVQEDS